MSPAGKIVAAWLSAAALALAGCGGGGLSKPAERPAGGEDAAPPAWVTEPPSGGGYAYGVGSAPIYADPASALSRAQDRARAELLKRLEVTVSGRTRTTRRRTVEGGESRVTRSVMDTVDSRVAETRLRHVEIVETHAAEGGETAYALARLDRAAAQQALIGEIEALDARLREIAARDPGGARLQRLRALMPALGLLAERRAAWERLRLIAAGDPGHRLPEALRALEARITGLLDALVVALRPEDQPSRRMASALRRALTQEGVRVQEGEGVGGDLLLRYATAWRTLERDGRSFVFADGSVTVLDRRGAVINEFRERVKAGSVDAGLARDRAVGRLAERLAARLGESLLASLERAAGRDGHKGGQS